MNKIIQEESQEILNDEFTRVNKAVVVAFGDLKNYLYHYK